MSRETTISSVMEFLLSHMASRLPPAALADVFDRLIWCLKDNGEELIRVRNDWLQSDDLNKVAVALAMDEVFPFGGGERMLIELNRISKRWPELEGRCTEILGAWQATTRSGKPGH